MNNLEALDYGIKLLKKNKISSYNIDSELLLANIQNLSRESLLINLDRIIKKCRGKNLHFSNLIKEKY